MFFFTIVLQGICDDKVNGFDCFCQTGFSGIRCEVDVNDCLLVSCGNGEAYRSLNVHFNALYVALIVFIFLIFLKL